MFTQVTRESQLEIIRVPSQGVPRASKDGELGAYFYQHGGASMIADQLRFRMRADVGDPWQEQTLILQIRKRSATVRIVAPVAGADLRPGALEVLYEVSGPDFDHLHIALNGEGHNTIRDLSGVFVLNNVPIGEHEITAQLVDASHRSVRIPSARDTVKVSVRN